MTTGYRITGQASARRSPFKVSTSKASFEGKLVLVGPIKRRFTPDHFVIALTSKACQRKNGVDAGSTFYWACRWSKQIRKIEYQRALMRSRSVPDIHLVTLSSFYHDDYHNNLRQSNLKQLCVFLHGTS